MPNTSQLTSNIKDISSQFNIVRPLATPFLTMVMSENQPAQDVAHFYQSQVLSSAWDTVPAGATNSATSFTVGGTARHYVGELLLVDGTGEIISVGAVAGNALSSLTRGVSGGAAAATIPANAKVRIISRGTVEGEEGSADHVELSTQLVNYTQIFRKRGSFTGSALAVKTATMENDISKQVENFIAQIKHEIEIASVYGIASATSPRRMGGVASFIPAANTQAIGAALTLSAIDNAIGTLFNLGGTVDCILTSPRQYNALQSLAKQARLFVTPDNVDYKNYFETYSSAYSPVKMKIVPSPAVADSELFILDSSKVRVVPLDKRHLVYEELAKTGDNVPFHVISEVTLEAEAMAASGWRLTGLS